ncbi:Delta(3,5)-Delta(2,4)-dienoyl-CoA isomerase, mitochondrial [Sphaceloma murrayae]|uniref:Delta(3,5)-Delta(2,4)-dienoyl-CoA isomerase, mitochondrial n=1 Tax=Sphaceloma murrayae TaxID=2082308 RepID=A0A2K1QVP4_9PEZI|nr:Delta(3,5)-Delta(2,4)-dienoyl-CoA isomerase, mitochondrial [Sphaceloma murrayae]
MADKYKHDFFNVSFPHEFVAVVEINRPEKLNAFKEIQWLNLQKIFDALSHDPDVRVVVLTAAGDRAFCSGLDVEAAAAGTLSTAHSDGARQANHMRRHIFEFQACITSIEKCEKPVIALLHGITFGLGIDISLACDIRLCTATTRFSVKEVDIGLAADIGTLTRLPHANVPMSWVKEVCLTAREFGGEEALRVGFVSGVVEGKEGLLKKGMEMARLLAGKSPVAVVGTKELLNYSRDHGVTEGLNYTAVWNAAYTQTADMKDAILAGLKKKKVTFAKL